jgi:hypothetical protein
VVDVTDTNADTVEIMVKKRQEKLIFDATVFSTLMGCARLVDLRHNHNFAPSGGKSNSLEAGSLTHKILEVYYKLMIAGLKREQAIGHAMIAGQLYISGCPHCADGLNQQPACKHQPKEYPGLVNTPEHNEKYKVGWRWVLKTCEQYFDFYKNDAWIPLAAEAVKGEVLYEDDEISVLWKSKLDLIVDTNQDGIMSIDHKTFKQRRDKNSLSNQFIGQCLLLKTRKVLVNKIGFQTSLDVKERFTREVVNYSADRLLEWQTEILPYYAYMYVQHVESGFWPPNFTHCMTIYGPCEFVPVCEANRNMREEVLRNDYVIVPAWDIQPEEEEK